MLETERLILRRWEESDAENLYYYARDPTSVLSPDGRRIRKPRRPAGSRKSSDLRRICGEMRMTIAQVMQKMISFSEGNIHDIDHFIRVWTYAKTIGELEHLDQETQYILEVAAITHDIACPLCREKYGNTNGKYQEAEGIPMVKAFLRDTGISASQVERVQYLVGHHHTFSCIDGIDLPHFAVFCFFRDRVTVY